MTKHWISRSCEGERCAWGDGGRCGAPAAHKVEETIFADDPMQPRHPLTAYLCASHFDCLMGPMADHVRQLQLATLDPPGGG